MKFDMLVAAHETLNANQRLHWAQRAKISKAIRWQAYGKAAQALINNPLGVFDRGHVTVWVAYPDRRRRDVHNLYPTIKAAIDGIVDAGVLPDDSDKHLIGPDLRVPDHLAPKGCVHLAFEVVTA